MQWWCAAQGIPWTWEWRPYPGVWLFVLLLAAAYLALPRRSAAHPPATTKGSHGSTLAFATGLFVLWVSLDWPIGALGAGYLASVHMVQFLLMTLLAPPFLLLGLPRAAYEALERAGGAVLRVVTHPLVTMGTFAIVTALTHWPPIVDTLMDNQLGSFAIDMAWLGAGLLFWWPVAAPLPARSWLGHPARIGYLIAATLTNTGVFAYLTFSDLPLYATYELAPPVAGLGTREDQVIAGLLMKMGGALILWTSITILFFRWAGQQEREDAPGAVGEAA